MNLSNSGKLTFSEGSQLVTLTVVFRALAPWVIAGLFGWVLLRLC